MDRLMSRLRDDFSIPLLPRAERRIPLIAMRETDDALMVTAEIPGVEPEDIEISIVDENLVIRGEVRHEIVTEHEGYQRTERRKGTFTRTIRLPCRILINDVEATYTDGILQIEMPKCKPEEARKVTIKVR